VAEGVARGVAIGVPIGAGSEAATGGEAIGAGIGFGFGIEAAIVGAATTWDAAGVWPVGPFGATGGICATVTGARAGVAVGSLARFNAIFKSCCSCSISRIKNATPHINAPLDMVQAAILRYLREFDFEFFLGFGVMFIFLQFYTFIYSCYDALKLIINEDN